MEITINLGEILTDEYGNQESLAESIKCQIVEGLSKKLQRGIMDKVDSEVSKIIEEQIKTIVECQLPSFASELIDKEYTIVDKWGSNKETTTIRNKLINTITQEMVYKPTNYDRDKNYFTKNVDEILSQKMKEFKKDYDAKIDEVFTKQALEYAFNEMKKKLGK